MDVDIWLDQKVKPFHISTSVEKVEALPCRCAKETQGLSPATPTALGSIAYQQPFSPHDSQRGGPKSTVSRAFSCSFCRWLRSVIFSTVPVMVVLVTASLLRQRVGAQVSCQQSQEGSWLNYPPPPGTLPWLWALGDCSPLHSRTQNLHK